MRVIGSIILSFLIATGVIAQSEQEQVRQFLAKTPHPRSASEFQGIAHQSCLNQKETYICWSFSTSSFLESEMQRLHLPAVRLSVNYPVYCRFMDKAKLFVQTKGASRFAPGDLFSGVMDTVAEHGVMPASVYGSPEQITNQKPLYDELNRLMQRVKEKNDWNEANVLRQVAEVLDKHLGKPPEKFSFQGEMYTPATFRDRVVKLPWQDYMPVTSFLYAPFNRSTSLHVPDNWCQRTNFLNVPLDVFYDSLRTAVKNGFSVAIDIDNTEASYAKTKRYAFVLDAGPGTISQKAREEQFVSGATTDDHLIHVVGYKSFQGEDWFLAKDSWNAVWDEGNKGYIFLHESYIRMKVLAFLVHKDAVPTMVVQK